MRRALPPVAVAVVFAAACTTIVEELPNQPSAPAQSPIPVVVIPIPIPTAPPATQPPSGPAPAPGGTPAPGATPTPNPAPPPSGSCSLPPGTGNGQNCPVEGASFQDEVDHSIDQLIQQRPDIFSGGGGSPLVVKHSEYMNGVVANLRARGLCAIVDSDDEIAVKNTNAFNDQYDILLSTGHVRRAYTATCRPAWF